MGEQYPSRRISDISVTEGEGLSNESLRRLSKMDVP